MYVFLPTQDECAWAIGNLAGGNAVCRDILRTKGAVEPLIALLKVVFNLLQLAVVFSFSVLFAVNSKSRYDK